MGAPIVPNCVMCDLFTCAAEGVSMAILIGGDIASTINIAEDSNSYHGYSVQVFFC